MKMQCLRCIQDLPLVRIRSIYRYEKPSLWIVYSKMPTKSHCIAKVASNVAVAPGTGFSEEGKGLLRLDWPAELGGTLQSASKVQGPYRDTEFDANVQGDQFVVEVSPDGAARYFRLLIAP